MSHVSLTYKDLGAAVTFTRKLLVQASVGVEEMLRADIASAISRGIDQGIISGSGSSNQPTGLLSVTGIGDVSIATNGGAPTWAHIVSLEAEVAKDNAEPEDPRSAIYLVNATTRAKLKTTEKASGTAEFVWDTGNPSAPVNGHAAYVSNHVPSNLSKGSASALSAIMYGDASQILLGFFGGLDLLVDPNSARLTRKITISAYQAADVAIRHPEAWAAAKDADVS